MNCPSLNLWADEEKRIHQCLILALQKLIAKQIILTFPEISFHAEFSRDAGSEAL